MVRCPHVYLRSNLWPLAKNAAKSATAAQPVLAWNVCLNASKYTLRAISWISGSNSLSTVTEWRISSIILLKILGQQTSSSHKKGFERERGQGEEYHFLFIWYFRQCTWQSGREDILDDCRSACDAPDHAHGSEEVNH